MLLGVENIYHFLTVFFVIDKRKWTWIKWFKTTNCFINLPFRRNKIRESRSKKRKRPTNKSGKETFNLFIYIFTQYDIKIECIWNMNGDRELTHTYNCNFKWILEQFGFTVLRGHLSNFMFL